MDQSNHLEKIISQIRDLPHYRDFYTQDKIHLLYAIAHLGAITSDHLHKEESVQEAVRKITAVSNEELELNLKQFFGI